MSRYIFTGSVAIPVTFSTELEEDEALIYQSGGPFALIEFWRAHGDLMTVIEDNEAEKGPVPDGGWTFDIEQLDDE